MKGRRSNRSSGEGNTKSSPRTSKKQVSPAKRWLFVLNNYTKDEEDDLVPRLNKFCNCYFYSYEVGESGTPHIQGYVEFIVKRRGTDIGATKRIHWGDKYGFCCKADRQQNYDYITKVGPIIKSKGLPVEVDIITELRPFQQQILDILLGPVNKGKIVWIYDEQGQLGKTEMIRYCFVKHGIPFSYGGKCADIINLVFNNKNYMITEERPALFYNFGRDTLPERISYKSMEQVSDGAISNTKFEAGCFVCRKPHVIVGANCLPVMESMTSGRFIIKTINPVTLTLEDFDPYTL